MQIVFTSVIDLIGTFERKFDILSEFENSGFGPAIAKNDVRVCLVAKNYQIIYQINREFIVITRIVFQNFYVYA